MKNVLEMQHNAAKPIATSLCNDRAMASLEQITTVEEPFVSISVIGN